MKTNSKLLFLFFCYLLSISVSGIIWIIAKNNITPQSVTTVDQVLSPILIDLLFFMLLTLLTIFLFLFIKYKLLSPLIENAGFYGNINNENKFSINEEIFSKLFYSSPVAISVIDTEKWSIIEANTSFYKMLHYSDGTHLLNKSKLPSSFKEPNLLKEIKKEFKKSESARDLEFTLNDQDVRIDILYTYEKINLNKKKYLLLTLIDITQRNKVLNDLRESEEKFRLISSTAPTAIFMHRNEEFVYVNKIASEISGYNVDELLNMKFWEIVHPDYRTMVKEMSFDRFEGRNETNFYTLKIVRKNGEERWLEIYVGLINIGGKATILGIAIDITERKESEDKVAVLVHTIKSISEAVTITDNDNNVLFINDAFTKIFGYTADEILGQNISLINSELETVESVLVETKNGGWEGELVNTKKDGSKFPIFLSTSIVYDDSGKTIGLVGISKDITEKKITEEKILSSLKEKEMLLREVHHRVKNNMQIVTSLINLQKNQLKNEEARNALTDAASRIKTMALIHEKLYKSLDVSDIDFALYISELCNNILSSFRNTEKKIDLNINSEKILLNIDLAISLGLIVNEFITNSVKHAFTNTDYGKINIQFYKSNEGKFILKIEDNGIGINEKIDLQNAESLGLRLVNSLVKQINGNIKFYNSGGTKIEIDFPATSFTNKQE